MKKGLALLLAAALVLLCGCMRQPEGEPGNGHAVGMTALPKEYKAEMPEETSCVLKLSVNPEFVVYLDENGTILKVSDGNRDARDVLSGISELSGKSFRDGVRELLLASYDKGYLKEGSEVMAEAYLPEDISRLPNLMALFLRSCEAISREKNISFSNGFGVKETNIAPNWDPNEYLEADVPAESSTEENSTAENSQESTPAFDTSRFQSVEYDENGHVIRTVEKDTDGNSFTKEYDRDGNCVKESCRVLTAEGPDDVEMFFDADGRKTRETHAVTFADGTEMRTEIVYRADGSYTEKWTSTSLQQDGVEGTEEYGGDGTRISSAITFRDGMHADTTYYPNGQPYTVHQYGPFGDGMYTYSETGDYLAWDGLTNDGYHSHVTFFEDGTYKVEVDRPEGTETITGLTADYGKNGQ